MPKGTVRLSLPESLEDVVALADWLEIQAICSEDGNSSIVDLERSLKIASKREVVDQVIPQVAIELERRVISASAGYPFLFERSSLLSIKEDTAQCSVYLFCLALSYFGWKQKRGAKINPRNLFEELCGYVAANYLDGQSIVIGTAKRAKGDDFFDAVDGFIAAIREGGSAKRNLGLRPQDDHLDIIAWRSFGDQRKNKVILFGNCASGQNWDSKLTETIPNSWWELWVNDFKTSAFVKSFFIPGMIFDDARWEYVANRSDSILFDRCRITQYSIGVQEIQSDGRYLAWATEALGAAPGR